MAEYDAEGKDALEELRVLAEKVRMMTPYRPNNLLAWLKRGAVAVCG